VGEVLTRSCIEAPHLARATKERAMTKAEDQLAEPDYKRYKLDRTGGRGPYPCRARATKERAMTKCCHWCSIWYESDKPQQKWCSNRCRLDAVKAQRKEVYVEQTGYSYKPSPNEQGALSELRVVADLLARGYMVFRNCSPSGAIDLIAVPHGEKQSTLRIQVKTSPNLDTVPCENKYYLEVHFDHYALVNYKGEIKYLPTLEEINHD
jgi:hypothetical protein